MKKITLPILALFLLNLIGCSVPTAARQTAIYSFIREEKKVKGVFGKKKSVSIKDFRGNEMYEEDIAALKEGAEKYISEHPEISEEIKNNLRGLKVTEGQTKEEVRLLLGEPDKMSNEIWIYKIGRIRAFTIFIIPVFFVHEGHWLYFKDNRLSNIERHYLRQVVQQSSAPGLFQKKQADSGP